MQKIIYDKDRGNLANRCKRVEIVRKIIISKLFTEEQITSMCSWLGFNDTSFKSMTSNRKLKDFLLNKKYWVQVVTIRGYC